MRFAIYSFIAICIIMIIWSIMPNRNYASSFNGRFFGIIYALLAAALVVALVIYEPSDGSS